jgi:hypothetical protein
MKCILFGLNKFIFVRKNNSEAIKTNLLCRQMTRFGKAQ